VGRQTGRPVAVHGGLGVGSRDQQLGEGVAGGALGRVQAVLQTHRHIGARGHAEAEVLEYKVTVNDSVR
jgi:hypothetical protein